MKKLGLNKRRAIIQLAREGKTAQQIATAVRCSIRTVFNVIKECPDVKLLARGGWKPKLSDTMLHHLKLLFITNQLSSPRQAKNYIFENFQLSVSERTLRRRLEKMGIKRYTKKKRPGLTQAQMKERKHFAKSREDWTEDQWDKAIFVDETTVYTYEYFGNRYY
jgi:transposase